MDGWHSLSVSAERVRVIFGDGDFDYMQQSESLRWRRQKFALAAPILPS
jgi:hypothetical protein